MKKRNNVVVMGEKRLLDANETCAYLGLGRNKATEFAKSIGAERKVGRRCLYDKVAIDRYFDKQLQGV